MSDSARIIRTLFMDSGHPDLWLVSPVKATLWLALGFVIMGYWIATMPEPSNLETYKQAYGECIAHTDYSNSHCHDYALEVID